MKRIIIVVPLAVGILTAGAYAGPQEYHAEHRPQGRQETGESQKSESQTTCPIMGGTVDKKYYANHDGKRIYFCCPMCVDEFKKDPAKYIKKLEDQGVVPDQVPGT